MSGQRKWGPDNDAGEHPYVITKWSWGRERHRIEYAPDLATAKRRYGWTSEKYTSVKVRRATAEDLEAGQ